jgi:hypothetical protein
MASSDRAKKRRCLTGVLGVRNRRAGCFFASGSPPEIVGLSVVTGEGRVHMAQRLREVEVDAD